MEILAMPAHSSHIDPARDSQEAIALHEYEREISFSSHVQHTQKSRLRCLRGLLTGDIDDAAYSRFALVWKKSRTSGPRLHVNPNALLQKTKWST